MWVINLIIILIAILFLAAGYYLLSIIEKIGKEDKNGYR